MADASPLNFEHRPHPNPTPADKRAEMVAVPGFGRVFTDHMVTIRYTEGQGWHSATLGPREPLMLDPATSVLHYAQEIFEGLKAYPAPDGGATLFRVDANARRFQDSAERMAMPKLPVELFRESVRELVRADIDWFPPIEGGTLYLRPFMIATEVFLGVKPASEYLFIVIASPAGGYFKGGVQAITLWATEQYSRAGPGGTGAAKCGGNYAASLIALQEAYAKGCDQILFLDTVERRWIEELGGMNTFFLFDDGTMITPPLTGTILPGITRDAIMTLASEMGLKVSEQPYSIDQWQADAQSGRLREAFACGTAAVITPIGRVRGEHMDFTIGNGGPGTLSGQLRDKLVAIQCGQAPDPHGWVEHLP